MNPTYPFINAILYKLLIGYGVPFMKRMHMVTQLVLVFSLLFFSLTEVYAKGGCCSSHGGVAGCDSSTGRQLCKDGTTSPSCACEGMTPTKPAKVTKTKPAPAQTTTTNTQETTTPAAADTSSKSTKGCCSRHGGVAQCNQSTGYFMCKDGTQSTSCKCS